LNFLDAIEGRKRHEIAQLPLRLIAFGDLRDAQLECGERRRFLAALRQLKSPPQPAPVFSTVFSRSCG
jgi:hypothetical protein